MGKGLSLFLIFGTDLTLSMINASTSKKKKKKKKGECDIEL